MKFLRHRRGCTTPVQIASLKGVIEGNLEYLDGYEDLTFEDQVKVERALENGHVDDEDWKGVSGTSRL